MSANAEQNLAADRGVIGPFRVTWRLNQPVCLGERPLHLDALLAWARVREAVKSGVTPHQAISAQEKLPLQIVAKGDSQVWKASALLFRFRSTPFLVQMTRRTSLQELAFAREKIITTRKNQISQATGPFKDFDLRVTCQWVEKVEAYGVGQLDSVRLLLNHVTAIGKLTRNGWGTIADMQIVHDDEAHEKWRYRTLPSVFDPTELHYPGVGCVRPPYWRRESWESVWEFAGIW
jgi:CRISPR type IV-associated protein Csf3